MRSRLTSALLFALVVAGCSTESGLRPAEMPRGLGLLLLPPRGSLVEADSLECWVYSVGFSEEEARQDTTAPGTGDPLAYAVAYQLGPALDLEFDTPSVTTWYRVFVREGALAGETTFELGWGFSGNANVYVALCDTTALGYSLGVYPHLDLGLGAPPATAFSGEPARGVLVPVSVTNESPIDGIEARFRLVMASPEVPDSTWPDTTVTEFDIYVDAGSRLFGGRSASPFSWEVAFADSDSAAFKLLVYPKEPAKRGGAEAANLEIERGSDILLYLWPHGMDFAAGPEHRLIMEWARFSVRGGEESVEAEVVRENPL